MTKMQLPYILSDCDGTITPTYSTIQPETLASILAYQKKSNNKFSFITGRNAIVNKQLIEQLNITLPIVSCNGALITDSKTGKVLHADYLDKDVVVKIARLATEMGLDMIIFEPESIAGVKGSSRLDYWATYRETLKKKYDFPLKIYDEITSLAEDIVESKIMTVEMIIMAETKKQVKDMQTILKQFESQVDYSQSYPILFNITKHGVNKGTGLAKWAEILQTVPNEVVVFGDNFNDIAMVEAVDHGYAMGNGVKELKQVAFQTIETMENDGVGKKLKEIMNNEY